MKLQTFLPLVTYADPNSESAVANAVAVSKFLNADLHVLALEPDIPKVSNALSNLVLNLPEKIQEAERRCAQIGSSLLDAATKQGADEALTVHTSARKANPILFSDVGAQSARYHDLTLMGWAADNPGVRTLAEGILFGSGRPTVLISETTALEPIDHIAIAWDGSRVAARAVADARPFLERASVISVITVFGEKPLNDQDAGDRLAESLRNAGLNASFSATRAEGVPIGEALQAHAAEIGAKMLVMGGFGHSRFRDFVLGGATAGVLTQLQMPVLLSH